MERDRQYASRRLSEERKWERERDRSSSHDSAYERPYHSDEERKLLALPESVAVDGNRSQNSELGYHSPEAPSDGYVNQAIYNKQSLRPVASGGSQGSGGRFRPHYHSPSRQDALHTAAIMNGETRFPFAMSYPYPGSEAAKSDIATVCSGSVTEDIDLASVASGGDGSQTTGNAMPLRVVERVGASIVMVGSGNFRRQGMRGKVEFAAESVALPSPRLTAARLNAQQPSQPSPLHTSKQQSLALMNEMGPPLSRALLDQSAIGESRSGSVRSFGSNAGKSDNSDVAAQVDTDDCGGSLNESVDGEHSINSQEDIRIDNVEKVAKKEGSEPHSLLCDRLSTEHPHGRTSPGGTIYIGKGVRRYRGRYMNLPLKRFHQNGVTLCDTTMDPDADYYNYSKGYENRRHSTSPSPPLFKEYYDRGQSPEPWSFRRCEGRTSTDGARRSSESPENHKDGYSARHNSFRPASRYNSTVFPDRGYGYAFHHKSRSRSRSRSNSPRRARSRTESQSHNTPIDGRRRSRPLESLSNVKTNCSPRQTGLDNSTPNQEPQRSGPIRYQNRRRHNSSFDDGKGGNSSGIQRGGGKCRKV